MKVALVVFLYDERAGGGASSSVRHLARGLVDEGHEVSVVTTARRASAAPETIDGVEIHRLALGNFYWIADKDRYPLPLRALFQLVDLWNPLARRRVARVLRRIAPDVVHVHKLRGFSPSVWASAGDAGVHRLLHTCQDYELLSPEGTLAGRLGRLARRGAALLRPYQAPRARASRRLAAATSPSRAVLDLHRRLGFFSAAQTEVVRDSHGRTDFEVEHIAGRAAGAARQPGPLRVLFLGRLEEHKGIRWLCRVVAGLHSGGVALELDVAGWGTIERELEASWAKHPAIRFHGAVEGEAKDALLEGCDLMAVPSLYDEISPVVISEAHLFGRPVLTTTLGGLPEIVSDGATGWIVPPGDDAALAGVLADLAADPDGIATLTPACLAQARALTTGAVARRYATLYTAADSAGR